MSNVGCYDEAGFPLTHGLFGRSCGSAKRPKANINLYDLECPLLGVKRTSNASRNYWKLGYCKLQASDKLAHEPEVKGIEGIAGEVVVGIAEKCRVRDH